MSILVMTVGTGDRRNLEGTLFQPFRKSIGMGEWSKVVLLPSRVTIQYAEELRSRFGSKTLVVNVDCLPESAEDDADKSYAHFDRVLTALRCDHPNEGIVVDFTRGTKAMSAAIVLAASRHGVSELRYIIGDRDARGNARPGSERVRTLPADQIDRQRRADLAREMVRRGNFAPAAELLKNLGPNWAPALDAARFYSAWDRLNYREAVHIFVAADFGGTQPPGWADLWPTDAMNRWTKALASTEDAGAPPPEVLRRTIVDLIANGERRVAQEQFEDALVRAYRILELIGQTRLFEHGLDSANLDRKCLVVEKLNARLAKKRSDPLQEVRGRLTAGREQVARLLKDLGDDLAKVLLDRSAWKRTLDPHNRNHSLLIHGFRARAGSDPALMGDAFTGLEGIARKGWPDQLEHDLRVARSVPSR